MLIEDFTKKFAGCMNTVPEVTIDGKTRFKKLDDWSSISALIVIAMVDAEYGKSLTAADIHQADTIEDLFLIIHSK